MVEKSDLHKGQNKFRRVLFSSELVFELEIKH